MPTFPPARIAITATFAAFGVAVGVWAGSVPTVARAAGLDEVGLGLALSAFTVAIVAAMAASAAVARRCSGRTIIVVMLVLLGLASAAVHLNTGPLMFYFAVIAFGATLGLTDVIMNAEASAIEVEIGQPIFASFHAAVSLSVAVFAILGSVLAVAVGPIGAVATVAAAVLAAAYLVYRYVPARPLPPPRRKDAPAPVVTTRLMLLGIAAGVIIAAETVALLWSARLLDDVAPRLAAYAGAGVAFFGLCNGLVRFVGDRLRSAFGDVPLMAGSIVVAIIGFVGVGVAPGFTTTVLAFALVGFGTAVLIPCIFALAAAELPDARAAGIATVATIAGLPRALAPWVFGLIAAHASMSIAFGLTAVLLLIALAFVIMLGQRPPAH